MAKKKFSELNAHSVIADTDVMAIEVGTGGTVEKVTISELKTEFGTGGGGAVDSVNGETGTVVLTTGDISEDTDKKYVTDAEKTVLSNTSGTNTGDQDLSGYALKSNVLELDNTTAFTPDADYEPATKKYVDDNLGSGDVSGPASSDDGAIVLFDGTTGKVIKDSDKTIVTTLGSDDTTVPTSKAVSDAIGASGGGDMLKSTYDTDDNGVVDNAEKLNGQADTYYLDRANHTGTQTASTISDFDTEVSNNTDVDANTTARHTHSNKTILDATEESFTTTLKDKLDGIASGAEVNVQSDWNQTDTAQDDFIKNKPTIPSNASDISTDTTNFNNNLSSADDTVQKALETLDDMTVGTLSNIVEDATPQLGGELDAQTNSIGFTLQTYTGVVGTTTIDWTNGNKTKFTFGAGNETLAFTAPSKPGALQLIIVQDSTGSRTITRPSTVKRPGGTAPTLSTAANAVDIVSFLYDGTNYYATSSLNFS